MTTYKITSSAGVDLGISYEDDSPERAALVVSYRDDDGNEHTVEGRTLADLAAALLSAQESGSYAGGQIRVRNDAGFTIGWVDAGHWSAV